MNPTSSIPTVRELIAEYASIEDRVRSVEAQILGGSAPPLNPELVRLAERERHVLALLRRHQQRMLSAWRRSPANGRADAPFASPASAVTAPVEGGPVSGS